MAKPIARLKKILMQEEFNKMAELKGRIKVMEEELDFVWQSIKDTYEGAEQDLPDVVITDNGILTKGTRDSLVLLKKDEIISRVGQKKWNRESTINKSGLQKCRDTPFMLEDMEKNGMIAFKTSVFYIRKAKEEKND